MQTRISLALMFEKYEKLLQFYVFEYCVFFIHRIQVYVTKIERRHKIAGNLPDPQKITEILRN